MIMIKKSKFIENLWFVEVPNDISVLQLTKTGDLSKIKKWNYNNEIFLKNIKTSFLTKLATEEDWKKIIDETNVGYAKLIVYRDYLSEEEDYLFQLNTATESGLSLLKAEGLDLEKNYLIIKSE